VLTQFPNLSFQEIFYEHATHLIILNEYLASNALVASQIPEKIRNHVLLNFRSGSRHSPYFLHGPHGSGKSTLITQLYSQVTSWFDHIKIHRLIRFSAATPRAAYNLELLRVICQQISIILNIPEGYLPKDASFDPLYINNWFQNLLKRCEDLNNEVLFIFIDDLHKLNPLDCDIVAALSWLPISLPWNVYLICTTTTAIDGLKLTPIQKERFRSTEFLFDLTNPDHETQLVRAVSSAQFEDYITGKFDEIEKRFGKLGMARLATYITAAEYGLTETECLELLMPTYNSEAFINSVDGDFNFSTFRSIRNQMSK
jgi:NACHT domain- and WD repeat-containing protein